MVRDGLRPAGRGRVLRADVAGHRQHDGAPFRLGRLQTTPMSRPSLNPPDRPSGLRAHPRSSGRATAAAAATDSTRRRRRAGGRASSRESSARRRGRGRRTGRAPDAPAARSRDCGSSSPRRHRARGRRACDTRRRASRQRGQASGDEPIWSSRGSGRAWGKKLAGGMREPGTTREPGTGQKRRWWIVAPPCSFAPRQLTIPERAGARRDHYASSNHRPENCDSRGPIGRGAVLRRTGRRTACSQLRRPGARLGFAPADVRRRRRPRNRCGRARATARGAPQRRRGNAAHRNTRARTHGARREPLGAAADADRPVIGGAR